VCGVLQLFCEPGSLIDGFDNDPFVVRATRWLSLDDLAGDPEGARPATGSSIGRRQPMRSAMSSLARMPETVARTMIAAVRTTPTRVAARAR
jgi:hypothetical protein